MPEQVGKAAFIVMPSRSEGLPRFLLEVKAAGKPAVGSRVSGIPDAIEDGGDGFLFSSENDQELAQKKFFRKVYKDCQVSYETKRYSASPCRW